MHKPTSAHRRTGFTLIELLIVIVIGVVLISLAGPSFQRMIETQRLRSINSAFVTDLQFARAESASRHAHVRVTFGSDSTMTCYSIYTFVAPADQCSCTATPACTAAGTAEIKTVRIPASSRVSLSQIAGMPIEFAFDPVTGSIYEILTDFTPTNFPAYVVVAQVDTTRRLRTTVSRGGRPTVCRPATATSMQEAVC